MSFDLEITLLLSSEESEALGRWNTLARELLAPLVSSTPPRAAWRSVEEALSSPRVEALFEDAAVRSAMASSLFDGVVLMRWNTHGWGIPGDWRPALEVCRRLGRRTSGAEGLTFERLGAARDVALRHLGDSPSPLVPSADLVNALAQDDRLRLRAQWLQFASDGDLSLVRPRIEVARREGGEGPAWWSLLGAMGRGYAAIGEYEKAASTLEEALHGWDRDANPSNASRALCERMRVAAVMRDRGAVERYREQTEALLENAHEAAFARVALGRAWAMLGDCDLAAEVFKPVVAADHEAKFPDTSALRWYARVRPNDAREIRERLESESEDDAWVLARLDELVESRGTIDASDPEARRYTDILLHGVRESAEHRGQLAWRLGLDPAYSLDFASLAPILARYLEETRYG